MTQRSLTGFTLIEFTLVVAISGIIILGLSAVVDAPLRMAEEQEENGSIASADRLVAVLDEDVRFASGARVVSPTRLEVDLPDASIVAYEWDGSLGGAVTRTDASGSVPILDHVWNVGFTLVETPMTVMGPEVPMSAVGRVAGDWDDFTLKAGYQLDTDPDVGLTKVTHHVGEEHACQNHPLGITFIASGLTSDASATALRLRLRRNHTADLIVQVYKALPCLNSPDRNELVATAHVPNGALPVAMSDHNIALTSIQKLVNGERYFIELLSDQGNTNCIKAEFHKISVDDSAVDTPLQGLVRSSDGGNVFLPMASSIDESKAQFSFEVEEVTAGEPPTETVLHIPTHVRMRLQLNAPEVATDALITSFTLMNNLALVTQ